MQSANPSFSIGGSSHIMPCSNPWGWYSKHLPGYHWKSLDKLCSHQEVWWGITLLWKVQFVLKMLSLAWPVFPEVLFCCWMFCLFLKPFISHLQFLEMKIINQCSKWRRVTSHRGGDKDRTACPGDRSSFASADQPPVSFLECFNVLVKPK